MTSEETKLVATLAQAVVNARRALPPEEAEAFARFIAETVQPRELRRLQGGRAPRRRRRRALQTRAEVLAAVEAQRETRAESVHEPAAEPLGDDCPAGRCR